MTFSFRTIIFPTKGRKEKIVPMSAKDRRDNEELHRRREERRRERETCPSAAAS